MDDAMRERAKSAAEAALVKDGIGCDCGKTPHDTSCDRSVGKLELVDALVDFAASEVERAVRECVKAQGGE